MLIQGDGGIYLHPFFYLNLTKNNKRIIQKAKTMTNETKSTNEQKLNDMGIEICCENCVDRGEASEMCEQCKARNLCHFYPVDYVMASRIYKLQKQLEHFKLSTNLKQERR